METWMNHLLELSFLLLSVTYREVVRHILKQERKRKRKHKRKHKKKK